MTTIDVELSAGIKTYKPKLDVRTFAEESLGNSRQISNAESERTESQKIEDEQMTQDDINFNLNSQVLSKNSENKHLSDQNKKSKINSKSQLEVDPPLSSKMSTTYNYSNTQYTPSHNYIGSQGKISHVNLKKSRGTIDNVSQLAEKNN
jgi:hypothetical protein